MKQGARCDLCPLRESGVVVPPSPASGKVRLVIVGEGPGRTEEKLGRPFVGMSGRVLDGELVRNGIDRAACHVTNAALCRGDTDKENDRAAECCAPRLMQEMRDIHRGVPILTLGKNAARSVLNVRSILVSRGFLWTTKEIDESHVKATLKKAHTLPKEKRGEATLKAETLAGRAAIAGRTVLPTLHPSFILRADTWNPVFQVDMARAGRLMRGEIACLEDVGDHKVGGLEVLRGLGDVVSCDIETDGIKPLETKMLCVGLSDGKRTRVVWPWKKKYARPLAKFLAFRKSVVFHNGWNFDLLVMRQHGVVW